MGPGRAEEIGNGKLVRSYAVALMAILLFTFLPLLCVFASTSIAHVAGCSVNEGGTHPCLIMGTDVGGLLNFLFVAGWLMLLTAPLGVVASIVWLVLLIAHVITRSIKSRK